jgi:hypothetical protein
MATMRMFCFATGIELYRTMGKAVDHKAKTTSICILSVLEAS